jgi:hypothetical protein
MRKSKWAQLGLTIFMSVSGIFNEFGTGAFWATTAPSYFSLLGCSGAEIQIPQNSPSYRVKRTAKLIETLKNKLIDIPVHLNEVV